MRRILIILTLLSGLFHAWAQEPVDSMQNVNNWKDHLKSLRISLDDTITRYPKFIKTVLKSGRWVRQALYTYDSTYVEGFDNTWRFTVKCNNWFDTYRGHISDQHMSITMSSNITTKFGGHISYKGLGLGYMFNLRDAFTGRRMNNRRWDGSINTSRISVEWYYTKDRSDINIHRLGDYGKYNWQSYKFDGLTRKAYGAYAYYFFNHRHYCQSAAYGISRRQLKSAGSFILGLHANHQDISMNFDKLDPLLQDYLPDSLRLYRLTYRDYCFLVGYGFNWVPRYRWLVNITAIPSIGLRHSDPTSIEGNRYLLSSNIRLKLALVINRSKWSYGLNMISDGHWYRSRRNSFFNSSQDINLSVCFRL